MGSQHADPALTVRPPAEVAKRAKKNLEDRGLEVRGFVVACLNALNAEPEEFLGLLDEHWPPSKPRGRPPRPVSREKEDEQGADSP